MVSAKDAGIISVGIVSLILRYDAVLYPIDIPRLFDLLPEHGWIVPEFNRTTEGYTLERAPTKGKNSLRLDQGNKTLGVAGNDVPDVIKEYRELQGVVTQLGELAPEVGIDYLEFRYIGTLRGSKIPSEVFGDKFADSHNINELAQTVGRFLSTPDTTMGLHSIRLTPKGLQANRRDWAELTLAPVTNYGRKLYHFDIIYRRRDTSSVESVAEKSNEFLKSTISELET